MNFLIRKALLCSLNFFVLWNISYSQDLVFSQFYNAPLQFNPATVGIYQGPRFIINYRNQWPQLDKAYITYSTSYDQHFDKSNVSTGLMFLNEQQMNGIYNTVQAGGVFGYQMEFSKKIHLNTGLQINFVQRDRKSVV